MVGCPSRARVSVTGSPFCEHKKLRTSCALCKSAPLRVEATLKTVPYVPLEEREEAAEKRERRAEAIERGEPVEPKAARATGPGKPLLPQRKRTNRNISAAEADAVRPWWVKK